LTNELIIDASSSGERIALLRDKQLIELHQENKGVNFNVGDIYLGTIKKFKQELNACFVDIGYHKDAFLHYHDLGANIRSLNKLTRAAIQGGIKSGDLSNFKLEPETLKTGRVGQVFKKNQPVLVQILKEPISSKGPRLSTEISIAGKYFILVPFLQNVSVSKKVEDKEERLRLKNLASSLKGPNYGLICRTAAEGKSAQELHQDIQELNERWDSVVKNLKGAKSGQVIYGESSKSHTVLRDLLSEDFANIVTNSKESYKELKAYLEKISPAMLKALKQYKGNGNIFRQFGIDKQIKASFGKKVNIKGGSYLIVEHTEALHVIDVNSGGVQRSGAAQSSYALTVNCEAAVEIARQLRLRDMGGIIVIDFIDLKDPASKKKLTEVLKKAMDDDRAKHTILPMTRFGLVQITRQRVRPEMNIVTMEKCPMCDGTGKIESSLLLSDEIEANLDQILRIAKVPRVELSVNPFVHAYLTKGTFSIQRKWFFKYRKWIKINNEHDYHYGEYRFFDQNEEEIAI